MFLSWINWLIKLLQWGGYAPFPASLNFQLNWKLQNDFFNFASSFQFKVSTLLLIDCKLMWVYVRVRTFNRPIIICLKYATSSFFNFLFYFTPNGIPTFPLYVLVRLKTNLYLDVSIDDRRLHGWRVFIICT